MNTIAPHSPVRKPRFVGALLATSAACGGGSKAKKDVAYVARDVETLYAEAQRQA
jgi:outer membrane protein assembly factor BamD